MNPPIYISINEINNRLVFKRRYKLVLQTPETMKLISKTKIIIINWTKNGENVQSFEVFEVALAQCSLTDNHHLQKYEVLYTFYT